MDSGLRTATRWLLRGLDVLFVGLVLFVAVSGGQAGRGAWVTALLGAAFLIAYALGRVGLRDDLVPLDATRARSWPDAVWLAVLGCLWIGLMWLTPSALWVAFPLMFLTMHVLGPRWGVVGVACVTAVAVAPAIVRGHTWGAVGGVLGPIVGAAVAVAVVLGLEALARESHEKQQLVDELSAARSVLAEAERERAVLGERERLAREIHDTLAQGFSGIELLLRAARAQMPDGAPAALVDQAAQTARDNLTEARRFVRALTPASLADDTLVAALRREADRAAARQPGLEARVDVVGEPQALPMPVEAACLRLVQSALGNVVQHAGASHATVTLRFEEAGVTVEVNDDGRGFVDGEQSPSGGGFGLRGMRSRVSQLGGTLAVESAPGKGTRVTAALPKEQG